jgi:hypothetical protein
LDPGEVAGVGEPGSSEDGIVSTPEDISAALAQIRGERKRSKMGNRKRVQDGEVFDSGLELSRWNTLRVLQRIGEISDLRHHVKFPLLVQGVSIGTYEADFVYLKDGVEVREDAKGHQTKEFRRTAKHMAAMGLPVTLWPEKT